MADPKFKYPLRDSINTHNSSRLGHLDIPSNPALDEDVSIFQQSFLGLSIMDFTCNLGFNSSASTLSLNLVQDDAFYYTPLVRDGIRNAVTEGYHPWDVDAFPKGFINNYHNDGDIENFPEVGSPVYFKYYDGKFLNLDCVSQDQNSKEYCKNVFAFNGILSRWDKQYSSSGFTYSVSVTDPREILENTTVILDTIAGRVAPYDDKYIVGSERSLKNGWNGYYNILNVYGYYEVHGFGASKRTEQGMKWFDYRTPFYSQYLNSANDDVAKYHQLGVLPALRLMLSGRSSRYINDQEPFGGPLWYGYDKRNVWSDPKKGTPPLFMQERIEIDGIIGSKVKSESWIHRYLVDIDDLINLSVNPEGNYAPDAAPQASLLPHDFEIQGDRISLLQLIQQVCDAAGCDFMVQLLDPRQAALSVSHNPEYWDDSGEKSYEIYKQYSGVIKVIPLRKNKTFKKNIIRDTIDNSQKTPPKGPLVYKGSPILISASVGKEFTDPIAGQVLYGAPRTRVVGVTPLGLQKDRLPLEPAQLLGNFLINGFPSLTTPFYNEAIGKYDDYGNLLNPVQLAKFVAGLAKEENRLQEWMPNIEIDGVTLTNQDTPKDEHGDKNELGWNPYGPESAEEVRQKQAGKPINTTDFAQDLPPVSNDDYLPWVWAKDFSDGNGKDVNPFQFNRVNSRHQRTAGTCDGKTCTKKFEKGTCINEDGDIASGYENKTACEEDEKNTWYEPYSLPSGEKKAETCKAIGGEMSDNEDNKEQCEEGGNKFTKTIDNDNSGYLDIYPCWGFKNEHETESEFVQDLLDDIVDKNKKGSPIKGFFNDDDPYRDFHPQEGIFGIIEWINPGIGSCFYGNEQVPLEKDICECNPKSSKYYNCIMEDVITDYAESECLGKGGTWEKKTSAATDGCIADWEGVVDDMESFKVSNRRWQSACSYYDSCFSGKDKIEEIHPDAGGKGNDLHTFQYSCTQGCFKAKDLDAGTIEGHAIVAYFTKDHDVGNNQYKKGEEATASSFTDSNEFEKLVRDGVIKFIQSDEECKNSTLGSYPTASDPDDRISKPIDKDGNPVDKGEGNTFSSGGGLYSEECQAISYRHEHREACVVQADSVMIGDHIYYKGAPTPAKKKEDCEVKELGGSVKWELMGGGELKDPYYNKIITSEQNAQPGFIDVRLRLKGTCEDNEGVKIDASTEYDCFTKSKNAKVRYIPKNQEELDANIGIPLIPRTATIPIDLKSIGYNGGPEAPRNGIDPYRFKKYYYATVTELRHAAVSKESWTQYLRELAGHLPCWMYRKQEDSLNVWKDYCLPARPRKATGGASGATEWTLGALAAAAKREDLAAPTAAVDDMVGRKNKQAAKDFVGQSCGDDPKTPDMFLAAKTRMQVDMAYSIIKKVADQFYGRKYLVPLPFNPPTSVTCSNPNFTDEETCVEHGFDWGPHGIVSSWYRKFGIGSCFDMNGGPLINYGHKLSCETNGGIWIEPLQEQNKWEITSGGWPGGNVSFKTETAGKTGYPQNMNFWTDDGNLKSFALFPPADHQRLSGKTELLSFFNIDPEQFDTESGSAGPDDSLWKYERAFVSTEVDPKTYWLPERPDWEIHHEKQYWRREAGDNESGEQGGQRGIDIFSAQSERLTRSWSKSIGAAVVGPSAENEDGTIKYDLTRALNTRDVYIREPAGYCRDKDKNIIIGPENEDECKEKETDDNKPVTWVGAGKQIVAAYKPYALITLPNQVLYGNIDHGKLQDGLGGKRNHMCIPLNSSQGFGALLTGWLMGADATGADLQFVHALLNYQKQGPNNAPDLKKAGFVAAAYKPWHAAVPQQSRHYRWGPWAVRNDYGKVDVNIDDSLHPAAFSGETAIDGIGMAGVRSAIVKSQREIESGNVTISTWGHTGWCGNEDQTLGFDAETQVECEEIDDAVWHPIGTNYHYATAGPGLGDQLFGTGPYITDINVSIGSNGVNITYNLSTQKRFGDTELIHLNRIKKTNNDILRARLESEKAIARSRRGIETWKKPPSE